MEVKQLVVVLVIFIITSLISTAGMAIPVAIAI